MTENEALKEIERLARWATDRGGKEDAAAVIEDIRNIAKKALKKALERK